MLDRRFVGALAAPLLLLCWLGVPNGARAQTTLLNGFGGTAGYGPDGQCLSPNDDGSSASIDITPYFPGGLRFFTATQTRVYVNTNGNITFHGPVSTYTPSAFPVADQPMIAPYWADVDIRETGGTCMGRDGLTCSVCAPCQNPSENGVWWYGEPGRMVFTWDRVGRYSCKNDLRMSFQLVLTAAPTTACGGAGDFDVEFRFNRCDWEVGDASNDTNGDGICEAGEGSPGLPPIIPAMPCTPAQSGFDAGNGHDFVSIMGSMMHGINTHLCTMSNVGMPGIWRFQIRSGTIMCPGAGAECDTGMPGVCSKGRTNCVGMGTACVQNVTASDERCDALDNDCDGMVDEGSGLCPSGQVCDHGRCLADCFEGGCLAGQMCTSSGLCVESACATVTCPAGQRCSGGMCVGACDGVTCPAGQTCSEGACIDPCAGITCDDCTVCKDGECVARCPDSPCPSGQTCQSDGSCIASACDGVTCPAGSVCQGGSCVDACTGAVCPDGQHCVTGECVRLPMPDGGPPGLDAGGGPGHDGGTVGSDAGGTPGNDAGSTGGDAGTTPTRRGASNPGCACLVATDNGQAPLTLLFSLVLSVVLALRRRRTR